MKSLIIFLNIALLSALSFAGGCNNRAPRINPSKNYISRNYKVTDFSAIDVSTVGDVFYTQSADGETKLEIYGPDNIIELIDVSIKNNTLYLSMEKKNRVRNVKKMKIMISTPDLNNIVFNGVGNVNVEGGLSTTNISVGHHGVGDINIKDLTANELSINSTGVGNARLAGEVSRATLDSRGVGNIEAEDLKAGDVEAAARGVGSITCYATESISATVDGVGSIKYKGTPEDKRISKNGIGSIKQF